MSLSLRADVTALVALGSSNPAKRRGVEAALARALPGRTPTLLCVDVRSGVPDQPWGDAQTLRGAENRALAALRRIADDEDGAAEADIVGIGIEGGLVRSHGVVWSFSWAVALDSNGRRGAARSASFALPAGVAELLESGLELGDAVDRAFGVQGSKRAGGAVGLLTAGALDRSGLYAQVVVLALMPLLRRDLYRHPAH
jgi:inosine/xanthosine triphosphatase